MKPKVLRTFKELDTFVKTTGALRHAPRVTPRPKIQKTELRTAGMQRCVGCFPPPAGMNTLRTFRCPKHT